MKQKRKLNRAQKWFLLAIGLFLVLMIYQAGLGSFSYMPGSNSVEYKYGGSDISSFSMYIAFAILVIMGFNRSPIYFKKTKFASALLILLSIIMAFYFASDVVEFGLNRNLAQSTGPIVFFILWGLYLGQESDIWDLTIDVSRILGPTLLIISLLVSLFFVGQYGGHIGNSPQIMLLGNGFWPLAIAMLGNDKKDTKFTKFFLLAALGCALVTAFLYGTRSWIIQCILLLILYLFKDSNGKVLNLGNILLGGVLLYVVFNTSISNFTENWDYLSGRMANDTRSFQYQEIFNQFSFTDLFFGQGTYGTYQSSLYGDYKYIDNTLIYTWFHWGFVSMLCLAGILLYPPIKIILSKRYTKGAKMRAAILVLWFLALNGLSVYNTMTLDLRNALIVLALGNSYREIYQDSKYKSN